MSKQVHANDWTAEGPVFPQELEGLSGRVNVLSGQPLEVEKLSGGLTNTNFKVSTPGGCYVVRLASDNSNLLEIDRESEYVNSVRAAEAGVGAPVIERLDTPNVLVVGFIDGRTLSASDLQHGHLLQRVAGACRQLHGARRFRSDFNMFDVQRRYLEMAISRGFRIPDDYQDFEELFVRVRRAMEIAPEPTVPCNNPNTLTVIDEILRQ